MIIKTIQNYIKCKAGNLSPFKHLVSMQLFINIYICKPIIKCILIHHTQIWKSKMTLILVVMNYQKKKK